MAYYYEKASVLGEDATSFINNYECTFVFSTTNEDGSPNAAIFIPRITEDQKYIYCHMAPNNTLANLKERPECHITCVVFRKEEENKFDRTRGLRIKTRFVGEQNEAVKEEYGVKSKALFLEVLEMYPIG